jgi:hypothetical protein
MGGMGMEDPGYDADYDASLDAYGHEYDNHNSHLGGEEWHSVMNAMDGCNMMNNFCDDEVKKGINAASKDKLDPMKPVGFSSVGTPTNAYGEEIRPRAPLDGPGEDNIENAREEK